MPRRQVKRGGRKFQPEKPLIYVFCEGESEQAYAFERRFMSMYKSPRFLKDTFNYIYLPLSRNSQDGTDMMDSIAYRRRRSMLYSEKDIVNKNYLNDSLRYVEEIIRTGCMRITTTENSINSKFRSNCYFA